MQHSESRFEGKGGVDIYWQRWLPDSAEPRAVVVVAHGLGEHSGRYQHVAEALVASGHAVYALDHRGHGQSEGARALVDSFARAIDDIGTLVEIARGEQPRKRTFLLGHSMGGALSLGYALRNPGTLYGLILSGPAVALDGAPPLIQPISKLLSHIVPKLGTFAIDPEAVSRDPDSVAAYAEDPLNFHGKVPVGTLGEIVRMVQSLPGALSALELPLLIMHGGDDKLAGVPGSRMVIEGARSTDKALEVYDGLYHEIFNEPPADRERVLRDMVQWIEARL